MHMHPSNWVVIKWDKKINDERFKIKKLADER